MAMKARGKIFPFLWYAKDAEAAARGRDRVRVAP
jgi:hypothetical protein